MATKTKDTTAETVSPTEASTQPAAEETAPTEASTQPAAEETAPTEASTQSASQTDTKGLSQSSIDKEAQHTGTILDQKPKRKVELIDRAALEDGRTPHPHVVGINGYVFRIPWNTPVEVPEPVYEILKRQHLVS